jgi:transposase-like protein
MKKLLIKLFEFFKLKSPCCNSYMDSIGEIIGTQIYECRKCKKQWF